MEPSKSPDLQRLERAGAGRTLPAGHPSEPTYRCGTCQDRKFVVTTRAGRTAAWFCECNIVGEAAHWLKEVRFDVGRDKFADYCVQYPDRGEELRREMGRQTAEASKKKSAKKEARYDEGDVPF